MGIQNISACLFFDQRFTLLGLQNFLIKEYSASILGQATTLSAASQTVKATRPSLVLMEAILSSELTLDAIAEYRSLFPRTRVLVISQHDEAVFAERSLRAGAHGFVSADSDIETMGDAIQTVVNGEVFVSARSKKILLDQMIGRKETPSRNPLETLTPREMQVFIGIGRGQQLREVACELDLCLKTIETYREKIKDKLKLHNSHSVQKYAMECSFFGYGHLPDTSAKKKSKSLLRKHESTKRRGVGTTLRRP